MWPASRNLRFTRNRRIYCRIDAPVDWIHSMESTYQQSAQAPFASVVVEVPQRQSPQALEQACNGLQDSMKGTCKGRWGEWGNT